MRVYFSLKQRACPGSVSLLMPDVGKAIFLIPGCKQCGRVGGRGLMQLHSARPLASNGSSKHLLHCSNLSGRGMWMLRLPLLLRVLLESLRSQSHSLIQKAVENVHNSGNSDSCPEVREPASHFVKICINCLCGRCPCKWS